LRQRLTRSPSQLEPRVSQNFVHRFPEKNREVKKQDSRFRAELDCSECSSTNQPQQKLKTRMTTPLIRNSISRSSLLHGLLLIMFVLAFVALPPTAQTAPPAGKGPPDGDLGNGNTAEGNGALLRLTSGVDNTAMGFDALFSNTTGNYNTAYGYQALYSNTTGGLDINQTAVPDWQGNTATGYEALYSNTTGS